MKDDWFMTGPLSLFVILSALKTFGIVDWSWWWISIPLWGPVAGVMILVELAVLGFILFTFTRFLLKRFLGMRSHK